MSSQPFQPGVLKHLNTAVVIHAPDTKIIYSNLRATTLLGLSEDQMLGKTAIDSGWHFITEQGMDVPINDYPVNLVISSRKSFDNLVLGIVVPKRKQATWVLVGGFPEFDLKGELIHVVISFHDITNQRNEQEAILKQEAEFRGYFNQAAVGIAHVGLNGSWIKVNRALCDIVGYSEADLLKKTFQEITHQDDVDADLNYLKKLLAGEIETYSMEKRYYKKSGDITWASLTVSLVKMDDGRPDYFISVVEDINERKKSQELAKIFFEQPIALHLVCHTNGKVIQANSAWKEILGYELDKFIGSNILDSIHPDDKDSTIAELSNLGKGSPTLFFENRYRHQNGSYKVLNWSANTQSGENVYALAIDVTEQKQTEMMLRKSEQEFRNLAESMPQIVWITRPDGWNTFFNHQWMDYTGLTREESIGHGWNKPFHPDDQKYAWDAWQKATKNLATYSLQSRIRRADGVYRWWLTRGVPIKDDKGNILKWFGTCTDIHDLKVAEQEIITSNRALASLSAVNHHLIHATTEQGLFSAVCQSLVIQSSYRMAWVGFLVEDEARTIRVIAQNGADEGFLKNAQITWADKGSGSSPCGTAVRSGKTVAVQNILTDDRVGPWREEAAKRGYASCISLPLVQDDKVFGVLTIYSGYTDVFDVSEVSLLEEMAEDLVFGVLTLRTRLERDNAMEKVNDHVAKLQNTLEGTIKAISSMVEMRDPYTAGHELRVAELAVAIAMEMGLSDEQIHGLYLAAEVHDLGKIRIPSELLSMPRKLNDIEYTLVQSHSQDGHDILRDIDFPWPIAQMILQHHERMDGSGYPQGLKGEAILLEARIIGVADVVEAMSSHRPYRPGLGIDMALTEITNGRGVIYDSNVADACLGLFASGKFTL